MISEKCIILFEASGGKAHSFQLDVTDRKKVYSLAEKIRETIGEVSMLINNAGIVTGRNFMECSDELIIKTMDVNTISHFWVRTHILCILILFCAYDNNIVNKILVFANKNL